tara:strand:- start:1229 stop:1555 length:327 start_codon:yes stop_codon:yes gene_type:complete
MTLSLIKIWKNKNQIYEGIKNNIFKKEHIEEIAAERLRACESCSHFDKSGSKCEVPGTAPCCGLCGCSLALKTRALSSQCADEDNIRWEAILNEQEEDQLNDHLNQDQ